MSHIICTICSSESRFSFKKLLLCKYDVSYFTCCKCGFIQTEQPYWLEESYGSVIAKADIGILSRNFRLSQFVRKMIVGFFNPRGQFLDYAGGYGIFTRLMRDAGLNFYHDDPYCENIYARYFSLDDLSKDKQHFELITAFEMMEHLPNPAEVVSHILELSDSFFFSTELQPKSNIQNWWYILPDTGQHISFYTVESLQVLAQQLGANFYTDGQTMHMISRRCFSANPCLPIQTNGRLVSRLFNIFKKFRTFLSKNSKTSGALESLLESDFSYTLKKAREENHG